MLAVDRWVRAPFFERFLALGVFRFDGETPPTPPDRACRDHLPLTRAIG